MDGYWVLGGVGCGWVFCEDVTWDLLFGCWGRSVCEAFTMMCQLRLMANGSIEECDLVLPIQCQPSDEAIGDTTIKKTVRRNCVPTTFLSDAEREFR